MDKLSLVVALKRTILEGTNIAQFRKEFKELTEKDKQDLVDQFNKEKLFGNDVEVVVKAS